MSIKIPFGNYRQFLDKNMNKKLIKYRANGIKVIKFDLGKNNYDKTMVFYKNGKPKQEKNYKNGDLNGNLISYWENGKIHTKGKYKNKRDLFVSLGFLGLSKKGVHPRWDSNPQPHD